MIDALLNVLAAFQDYGWFFALLGWAIALVLWSRTARGSLAWSWLPWSAGAGVAHALVELVMLATPVELSPTQAPHRIGDWLLGACTVTQITGWLVAVMTWRPARYVAALVVPGYAVARFWFRTETNLALLVVAALATGLWCWRLRAEGRRPILALLVSFLALAAASHGVMGDWIGQSRAWVEASRAGLLGSLLHAAAAATAVAVMIRTGGHHVKPEDRDAHRGDVRRIVRWGLLWLAAGVTLASGSAWMAQRNYSALMVQRAVTMAAFLDKPTLARALGPSFQIDEYLPPWKQPSGRVSLFGYSNWHRGEVGEAVRQMLERIRRHNADVRDVGIRVVWDNRVINCLHPQRPEDAKYNGIVLVEGAADESFQRDWDARVADFRGLLDTSYDEIAQARAPLIGPQGEMLGWLLLDSGVSHWIAVQTQARIQGYLAVVLGLGVAGLWVLQRRRERQREEARQAAEVAREADRAKGVVLATVSHELRTPLQAMLTIGELLRNDLPPGELTARAEQLIKQTGMLQRMVNDLIDLSALEVGRLSLQLAPTFVPAGLVEAAELLRPRATAKGLGFSVSTSGLACRALGDATRLRQIVTNLVGNAVKFTSSGGIVVDLECRPGGTTRVAVRISVSDTGPGLRPEQIAVLFKVFSQPAGRPNVEGAGLGLAIVRGLCEAMQGSVAVESDGRTGSKFTAEVSLLRCDSPDHPADAAAPVVTVPPRKPVPLRGCRVLLADDNAIVRQLFAEQLLRHGVICRSVGDGEKALALLRREVFDVAVLDLSMPKMDGLTVAREVRASGLNGREIWLIAASAHARPEDRAASLAAGFDVHLVKPMPLVELIRHIGVPDSAPTEVPEAVVRGVQHEFRKMAEGERRKIEAAIASEDWPLLVTLAHDLKNSAFAIHDSALLEAATGLESAARQGDAALIAAAWRDTRQILELWIPPPP